MKLAPLLRVASVVALAAVSFYLSRVYGQRPSGGEANVRVECSSGASELG